MTHDLMMKIIELRSKGAWANSPWVQVFKSRKRVLMHGFHVEASHRGAFEFELDFGICGPGSEVVKTTIRLCFEAVNLFDVWKKNNRRLLRISYPAESILDPLERLSVRMRSERRGETKLKVGVVHFKEEP